MVNFSRLLFFLIFISIIGGCSNHSSIVKLFENEEYEEAVEVYTKIKESGKLKDEYSFNESITNIVMANIETALEEELFEKVESQVETLRSFYFLSIYLTELERDLVELKASSLAYSNGVESFENEDWNAAISQLSNVSSISTHYEHAQQLLTKTYQRVLTIQMERNDFIVALSIINRLPVETLKQDVFTEFYVEIYYQLGLEYIDRNDYESAVAYLHDIINFGNTYEEEASLLQEALESKMLEDAVKKALHLDFASAKDVFEQALDYSILVEEEKYTNFYEMLSLTNDFRYRTRAFNEEEVTLIEFARIVNKQNGTSIDKGDVTFYYDPSETLLDTKFSIFFHVHWDSLYDFQHATLSGNGETIQFELPKGFPLSSDHPDYDPTRNTQNYATVSLEQLETISTFSRPTLVIEGLYSRNRPEAYKGEFSEELLVWRDFTKRNVPTNELESTYLDKPESLILFLKFYELHKQFLQAERAIF